MLLSKIGTQRLSQNSNTYHLLNVLSGGEVDRNVPSPALVEQAGPGSFTKKVLEKKNV
jgi:hypothetical protein